MVDTGLLGAGLDQAVVAIVSEASPWLGRLCATDPEATRVLGDLGQVVDPDQLPPLRAGLSGHSGRRGRGDELLRWKQLELLRIAARDLLGLDELEQVGANLSNLADGILARAAHMAGVSDLAVVAMGKLGARELNYASDIDLLIVGRDDPRPLLDLARRAWRVDLDLRPEGRAGPVTRSLDSYQAYWDRWADTWEFQALLKARAVAGDPDLGREFEQQAAQRVWGRPFGAEELRHVRRMKARAETEVAKRGLTTRELKLGRGGIRDIEFAVQLLQLVHGRSDETLRTRATLDALEALASGGYVAADDADALDKAYRFLRTVEHRLQLRADQQEHTLPISKESRERLARVLGYRDGPAGTAAGAFESELRRHQATVRSIHERLFFRPLLEAFTSGRPATQVAATPGLSREAVTTRLAAFGFSDAVRTGQAVQELTRGLTRPSRLMQQLLPLLLEWLSEAPDPDLGLVGLRQLTSSTHQRDQLTAVCRESPRAARDLCLLLGTGPRFVGDLRHHPDLLTGLADGTTVAPRSREQLEEQATRSLAWRAGEGAVEQGLLQFVRHEQLRIAARDVLGHATTEVIGQELTDVAEIVAEAALDATNAQVPFTVIAMGRLGGRELAYTSDLDLLLVFDPEGGGTDAIVEANRVASELRRMLEGDTPAARLYQMDTTLRPEGRHGAAVRSLEAYAAYYDRWAEPWERQALLRGRPIAGDPGLAARFTQLAEEFVWSRPLTDHDIRALRRTKARVERERLPAGEDPQFHLKLGRGSLSDVEWTAQLLQLLHGVRQTNTVQALDELQRAGALRDEDRRVLADAYRFCEHTRNRLMLVRPLASDALPATGPHLTALARSLGTTGPGLREEYRRLTRRARRVMEHLFYGRADG